MFPLAGKQFPTSAEDLQSAIDDALAEVFTLPGKSGGVSIGGAGKFPAIKTVTIDLDGATVSASKPPPKPLGTGKREPGPRVEKLELTAQPIKYEQAKLNLKVNATGLKFDFDRDKKGKPLLVLTDAKTGKVDAKISKQDIEVLLREGAALAAKDHGITIQDLDLDLESAGPRSVAADVRVKAKKMMMSGVIRITGKLDIDDELNATVSDLKATGEGMVGSLAAGIVQGKIKSYNGMTLPLMTFSLGDLTLRNLKIDVKKDLTVSASFGTA
ncbi:MAG TPA: hypothetical protein VER17_08310 [Tepidisphaeraceae bacterium]|nr:hypothetical protein [Tepidisphaeraceae bacterium]